ncbi:DUF2309 domain-containing protein [Marivirga arenosa]|uniref:Probable inorganic carbon transporter subunit DabA n=1 Tax=Marivirga arenosa TaxID=3059076 RepID=A0AA49GG24_9BACT|nr:DUF2309 domain-containing protein [Marivirga sp. ABR2-2]WKK84321.2 DUF2309 domain-containing protein [Marivirga sp. ABR2-2]
MQTQNNIKHGTVSAAVKNAASKIAPLWSLENFVAVNPYLGMADQKFSKVMQQLNITANAKATLPISFYLEALNQARITNDDIQEALKRNHSNLSVNEFIQALIEDDIENDQSFRVKSISELCSELEEKDWKRFMIDRISQWAAAYFDNDQAIWNTQDKSDSIYQSWKKEAEVDRSTELMGLKGFRSLIKELPNNYLELNELLINKLNIHDESLDLYLHSILMSLGGWAGFTSRIDWDANLAGDQESHATEELLAILLSWEYAFYKIKYSKELEKEWLNDKVKMSLFANDSDQSKALAYQLIMQDAFDIANQRQIILKFENQKLDNDEIETKKAQAIFCIDVRSELFRRNLEAADSGIETMGFAGFFAFPVKFLQLGHNEASNQCPVLLNTTHTIKETTNNSQNDLNAIKSRTLKQHVSRAWHSFKLGAISCFSFVGPVGLSYLPKLFTDSFGLSRPFPHPNEDGINKKLNHIKRVDLNFTDVEGNTYGISDEDQLSMAESTLRAMLLTEDFARTVMIVGHGSSTVNNPHATGLDCGACGGNTGEANAKVAAAVLNQPKVRARLNEKGIHIPSETHFIACQHDTTTDEVTIYNEELIPASHHAEIEEIKHALKVAAKSSRKERASRMNIEALDLDFKVLSRCKDWSQVRPEWGLAGCSSFIVAPRKRTQNLDFGAKAFLHSYDWHKDTEFGVLELIMTAPMVVTSWINLQYYASTVDNKVFGAGNKTLHNVVGGLGVLEGFGGDLRVGLPWQSVHDGTQYQHEPQRLNVVIEAPIDEMSKILEKHQSIRDLCDNEWIYLFAMNEEGKVAYQYTGDLEWKIIK